MALYMVHQKGAPNFSISTVFCDSNHKKTVHTNYAIICSSKFSCNIHKTDEIELF